MIFKRFIQTVDEVGKKSGMLSASWSVGSIVGTFLTGFIFIGYVGSTNTLLFISFVLFLCSFLIFNNFKKRIQCLLLYAIIIFVYFAFNQHFFKDTNTIYSKESNYYDIRIVDGNVQPFGNVRVMYLDADSHSIESLSNKTLNMYSNFYPAFSLFNKDIQNIAVLGGGSLALSNNMKNYYPQANVKTAEIDPMVTAVAKKYFTTSDYVVNNTVSDDGRVFLEKSSQPYDVIFSDAYNSLISVPWQLTTQEFFTLAKAKLSPSGIFAINFISSQEGETSDFYRSMLATFSSVFQNYYVFAYGDNPKDIQNIILIGLNSTNHIDEATIRSELLDLPSGNRIALHLVDPKNLPKEDAGTIIFTDNFAPTDRMMLPIMNTYFQPHEQFMSEQL